MNSQPNGIILLPHLSVQDANAISGPLSWGFPPPSAFAGLVHALHRKLGTRSIPVDDLDFADRLALDGVGIVCHHFYPKVNRNGYRLRFNLTKNPVDSKKKIAKDGSLKGTSIIEEGRANLELSLLIGVTGSLDQEDGQTLAQRVGSAIQQMRIAGGMVLPKGQGLKYQPQFYGLSGYLDEDRKSFRGLRRRLIPGFALIDRHNLIVEHHSQMIKKDTSADLLDTILDLCALHYETNTDDATGKKIEWRAYRRKPGWLVPLPVGYGAISELYEPGDVKNARDPECHFRFVESLYSLGEWRSPHRVEHVQELLWFHDDRSNDGLYLFTQRKVARGGA